MHISLHKHKVMFVFHTCVCINLIIKLCWFCNAMVVTCARRITNSTDTLHLCQFKYAAVMTYLYWHFLSLWVPTMLITMCVLTYLQWQCCVCSYLPTILCL